MKKLMLGLAVTSLIGFTGCSDGPEDPVVPEGTAGSGGDSIALTRATYDVSNGNIPLPNDLLFSGTENLTLAIPDEDELDASDPLLAIGGLDGWSSIAPISISFNNAGNTGDNDTDIQPSTIIPGSTIKLFATDVALSEVAPGISSPTGPVTGATELVAGVDYFATYTGPLSVAVLPLRPLSSRSNYMVVVTNGVVDTNNNPVITDGQYAIAQREDPIPAGGATSALEPVRQLVNAMENAADAAGTPKDDIILSFQFTVQTIGNTLEAAKGLYVDLPFSQGVFPATSVTPLNIPSSSINPALSGDALISTGTLDVNYMLEAPQSAAESAVVVTGFWKTAEMVPSESGFVPNPSPLDDLTYANPLPNVNSIETVPLLISLPSSDECSAPHPVLIFQHGITSNRTAMFGIADTMARACIAVVSMDMPLHGVGEEIGAPIFVGYNDFESGAVRERTFGVDLLDANGAPHQSTDTLDGPDSSGAHTINLANLRASRDNLRQAIFDLLTLEKAIPAMDVDGDMVPDFDSTKVYFMGHSLGGIVGSSFVAKSDLVSAAVLANPGGGVAGLLDASDTFGPRIRAGLQLAGVEPDSDDYQLFLVAAQTAVDSGDPANYADEAVTRETPVPTLMIRVAGDTVVPNSAENAPLSGTDPLSALLGLPAITESAETSRATLKFVSGTHGTVLTPAGPNAEDEFLAELVAMQTAIVGFFTSGGTTVAVTDTDLVEP